MDKFRTNIPGIYKVGVSETSYPILDAINDGFDLVRDIAGDIPRSGEGFDLIIVGAGPAGLSAALTAKKLGLNFLVLEKDVIGKTIANYPKGKIVTVDYYGPAKDKLRGPLWFKDCQKDDLVKRWHQTLEEGGIRVNEHEEVKDIEKVGSAFEVVTSKTTYKTRAVVLAVGSFGSPRKLGVDGEDRPNVFHNLDDPEKYNGKDILVVGGGNSAIEDAVFLSKNNNVTISYRKPEFFRLTEKNLKTIKEYERDGKLKLIFNSNVKRIGKDRTVLDVGGKELELRTDCVFLLLGFETPKRLLDRIGVKF